MLKKYLHIVALLLIVKAAAQTSGTEFHAWVYFTDKPNITTALATPASILTQKSIDRKFRHNIAVDARDVPMNQLYVGQIKNSTGITYLSQSKWFNCVLVRGQPAVIDALATLSFVSSIDYADPTKTLAQNSETKFGQTTTVPLTYGTATNQITMIGLNALHNTGNTGAGMTIAVTDSGFPNVDTNPGFAQLRANNGIAGGYDFVAGDASYIGDHFHGANVLSIMAGNEPGNFEGSAPDAQYYLFRTEDAATETPAELAYWVAAAERADSLGVDVINVSLGYLGFDNTAENLTYADMDGVTSFMSRGVNVAFEKGMVVITSAGNSGSSTTHPYVSSPADARGSFSIGSVTASGVKSGFSSIGPTADNRIKPDIVAQGGSTALINTAGNVTAGSGTSYSAPLVAGAMACLMQGFSNHTPQQIVDAVRASASQSTSPDNLVGYGIPDFGVAQQTLSGSEERVKSFVYYVQNDRLFIVTPGQNLATLKLYNVRGKQVLAQAVLQDGSLNLSELASGIYIFRIDGITGGFKIVK